MTIPIIIQPPQPPHAFSPGRPPARHALPSADVVVGSGAV